MSKYVSNGIKTIGKGETIEFQNKCKSSISVGMAVMFNDDGEYLVSIHNNVVVITQINQEV